MNKTNVRNIALSTPQWRGLTGVCEGQEHGVRTTDRGDPEESKWHYGIKQITDMENNITFENLPLL